MKRFLSVLLVLLITLQLSISSAAAEPGGIFDPARDTEPIVTEPTEPITEPTEPIVTEPSDPTEPTEATEPEPTGPEQRPDEEHVSFFSGSPEGAFLPNNSLTRAEVAVIMYKMGSYEPGPPRFPDVPDGSWYSHAVNALAAAGDLAGGTDGNFCPLRPITRAELVVVLAHISGKSCEEPCDFPDAVHHWASRAIALAQREGWVGGTPEGNFEPDRSLMRCEAAVILDRFFKREPDVEAIDREENLRFFPDVQKTDWFYYFVMEAASPHLASYETPTSHEHWASVSLEPIFVPNGFYCFSRRLFAVDGNAYVHSAVSGSLNGISYHCEGSSGICTAEAEVLTLASGDMILLSGGRPKADPGEYADGLYLKAGLLYAAQNGLILHQQCTGSVGGVCYTCTGANGVCQVEDWTRLSLPGVSLSVFAEELTEAAEAEGDEAVTVAEAVRAVVTVYERYFQVEYPLTEGSEQDWIDLALRYDLLDGQPENSALPLTRGQAASLLWRALRGRDLEPVNTVEGIPDLPESDPLWPCVSALYRAGVMGGVGTERRAEPDGSVSVSEFASLLKRLERPSERLRFSLLCNYVRSIQYGTSGSGRYPLTAWQIGRGENVMVLTFAIHGWEDNWDQDGAELVYLADQVKAYLDSHYDLVRQGNWTVYILRCLNPDGLYLGTTCNGPGRCTTTYFNSNGQLVSGKGIDMNRCFPYNFHVYTDSRNFNGTAPLQCVEARALANFIPGLKGSGYNLFIDTHGWLGQIITTGGRGTIYNAFARQFPNSTYTYLSKGYGYLTGWTGFVQGFDSCLLELPKNITSHNAFLNAGCVWRFENAITELLQNYHGPTSGEAPIPLAEVPMGLYDN